MKGFLTPEQKSDFLLMDEGTIRNYRNRYVEGGIFRPIPDTYSGKRYHLTDKEKEQISKYLQSKICMDSKEIVVYIQNKFDITEFESIRKTVEVHKKEGSLVQVL